MNELNIVVFGASRAGKTQLVSRYAQHTFSESYEATIEDLYKKEAKIDGKFYTIKILDTQGIEQFKAMRELYVKKADAFVVAYDTNEAASLSELEGLVRSIFQSKGQNIPLVFVGTKYDKNTVSKVATPEAVRIANRLASAFEKPHITSSAKLNHQVDAVFGALVRQREKHDASRFREGEASSSMSNLSIDGWLNSKLERENEVCQKPSLKRSMVKLRRSIAKLNGSNSMRNLRKVLSTASFHKTTTYASSLALREPANCNRRNASYLNFQSACGPHSRVDVAPAQGEIEAEENDQDLGTVTQSKLSELPHILDVTDKNLHGSGKQDRVCVIM